MFEENVQENKVFRKRIIWGRQIKRWSFNYKTTIRERKSRNVW